MAPWGRKRLTICAGTAAGALLALGCAPGLGRRHSPLAPPADAEPPLAMSLPAPAGRAPAARWRLGLLPYGFVEMPFGRNGWQPAIDPLGFTAAGLVTLGYPAPASKPPDRNYPDRQFDLHAIFVDTRDGHVHRLSDWSGAAAPPVLVDRPAGGFAVITASTVYSYDAGQALLGSLDIPRELQYRNHPASIAFPPDGGTVLLNYAPDQRSPETIAFDAAQTAGYAVAGHGNRPVPHGRRGSGGADYYHVEWLDVERLKALRVWNDPVRFTAVSGDRAVGTTYAAGLRFATGGGHVDRPCQCGQPHALGAAMLVYLAAPPGDKSAHRLVFATLGGDLTPDARAEIPLSADAAVADATGTPSGHRWAAEVGRVGAHGDFDAETVVALDTASWRWVFAARAAALGIKPGAPQALALSPDGSLLVVLAGATLAAYPLPPP